MIHLFIDLFIRSGIQLPFGQLPLLQIDGLEIVQSQAAVRYIAKRSNLNGQNAQDELKCDMIAEAVRDVLSMATSAPFARNKGAEEGAAHLEKMKIKWANRSVHG